MSNIIVDESILYPSNISMEKGTISKTLSHCDSLFEDLFSTINSQSQTEDMVSLGKILTNAHSNVKRKLFSESVDSFSEMKISDKGQKAYVQFVSAVNSIHTLVYLSMDYDEVPNLEEEFANNQKNEDVISSKESQESTSTADIECILFSNECNSLKQEQSQSSNAVEEENKNSDSNNGNKMDTIVPEVPIICQASELKYGLDYIPHNQISSQKMLYDKFIDATDIAESVTPFRWKTNEEEDITAIKMNKIPDEIVCPLPSKDCLKEFNSLKPIPCEVSLNIEVEDPLLKPMEITTVVEEIKCKNAITEILKPRSLSENDTVPLKTHFSNKAAKTKRRNKRRAESNVDDNRIKKCNIPLCDRWTLDKGTPAKSKSNKRSSRDTQTTQDYFEQNQESYENQVTDIKEITEIRRVTEMYEQTPLNVTTEYRKTTEVSKASGDYDENPLRLVTVEQQIVKPHAEIPITQITQISRVTEIRQVNAVNEEGTPLPQMNRRPQEHSTNDVQGTPLPQMNRRPQEQIPIVVEGTPLPQMIRKPQELIPIDVEGTPLPQMIRKPQEQIPIVVEGTPLPQMIRKPQEQIPIVVEGTPLPQMIRKPEEQIPIVVEGTPLPQMIRKPLQNSLQLNKHTEEIICPDIKETEKSEASDADGEESDYSDCSIKSDESNKSDKSNDSIYDRRVGTPYEIKKGSLSDFALRIFHSVPHDPNYKPEVKVKRPTVRIDVPEIPSVGFVEIEISSDDQIEATRPRYIEDEPIDEQRVVRENMNTHDLEIETTFQKYFLLEKPAADTIEYQNYLKEHNVYFLAHQDTIVEEAFPFTEDVLNADESCSIEIKRKKIRQLEEFLDIHFDACELDLSNAYKYVSAFVSHIQHPYRVSEEYSKMYFYGKRIKEVMPILDFPTCKRIYSRFQDCNITPFDEPLRERYIQMFCRQNNVRRRYISRLIRNRLMKPAVNILNHLRACNKINIRDLYRKHKIKYRTTHGPRLFYDELHPIIQMYRKLFVTFDKFYHQLFKYQKIASAYDYKTDCALRTFATQITYAFRQIYEDYFWIIRYFLPKEYHTEYNLYEEIPHDKFLASWEDTRMKLKTERYITDVTMKTVLRRYMRHIESNLYNPVSINCPPDEDDMTSQFMANHYREVYVRIVACLFRSGETPVMNSSTFFWKPSLIEEIEDMSGVTINLLDAIECPQEIEDIKADAESNVESEYKPESNVESDSKPESDVTSVIEANLELNTETMIEDTMQVNELIDNNKSSIKLPSVDIEKEVDVPTEESEDTMKIKIVVPELFASVKSGTYEYQPNFPTIKIENNITSPNGSSINQSNRDACLENEMNNDTPIKIACKKSRLIVPDIIIEDGINKAKDQEVESIFINNNMKNDILVEGSDIFESQKISKEDVAFNTDLKRKIRNRRSDVDELESHSDSEKKSSLKKRKRSDNEEGLENETKQKPKLKKDV